MQMLCHDTVPFRKVSEPVKIQIASALHNDKIYFNSFITLFTYSVCITAFSFFECFLQLEMNGKFCLLLSISGTELFLCPFEGETVEWIFQIGTSSPQTCIHLYKHNLPESFCFPIISHSTYEFHTGFIIVEIVLYTSYHACSLKYTADDSLRGISRRV